MAAMFYADVLGWTIQRTDDEFGGYVIAEMRGAAAAGTGPLRSDGAPPAWTLYFATVDADATADAAVELGGTVVLPPGDVGPLGRRSWPIRPARPLACGRRACTSGRDRERSGRADLGPALHRRRRIFYSALFGYRMDKLAMAGPDYSTFTLPGEDAPLPGIGAMMGVGGRPSHWIVYFAVPDASAAATAAERAGGAVFVGAFDTPFGRMANVMDPTGAVFWVVEPNGEALDRSG